MNVPEFLDKLQVYLPAIVHRQLVKLVNSKGASNFLFALLPTALITAIVSVYVYGNYVIFPALFLDSAGGFWWYFSYIGGAYVFHGICSHYYLISFRNSWVPNKYMIPFTIDDEEEKPGESHADGDGRAEEDTDLQLPSKSATSYFDSLGLATPCASTDWHPCFDCQAYVCPGSYHCKDCGRCILRRDHHCMFSRGCIGERNHVNFVGFIFHMVLGTAASSVVAITFDYNRFGLGCFLKFVKSIMWYVAGFFGLENILFYAMCQLVFMGIVVTSVHLVIYLNMCSRGQTSWERRREELLHLTSPVASYAKFEEFLGPNAILRILFPLFFSALPGIFHDRHDFIQKFNEMKRGSKVRVRISLKAS